MAVPAVSTRVGGVPHLIADDEKGRLFEVGDHRQLAAHLITLLEDREMRRRLGTNLREHARQNFSVERMATRQIEIYKGIIEGGRVR